MATTSNNTAGEGDDPNIKLVERTDFDAPTEMPKPRVIVAFGFAQFALFVALLGPPTVSIAIKLTAVVGSDNAPQAAGLVLGVGAIAALIAGPIFGYLSDRTTGPWGRRRPWMVGGSVGLALCLLVMAISDSVPVLIVSWFVAQLVANAALSAYLATIADQIPAHRHASMSALVNVTQQAGILVAVYAVSFLSGNMIAIFMVPAVIGVIGMALYSFVLPDKPLLVRPPSRGAREWLSLIWVNPREHPDFAWAFLSRFLFFIGLFLFTSFRLFWMQDRIGLDTDSAAAVVATGVLIYTVILMIMGQIAGMVSDRIKRRKPLVFVSVAMSAVGFGLLATVDTVAGFYWVEALLGIGYGIYFGADLALVIEVLPDPDNIAKDLGIFNIANAAPQSLAPLFGALLLAVGTGGQNYTLLYIVSAVIALLGAVAILPVKKVR
ncbi:MFS transporter [Rhodococcus sp. WMMA185]|uniref:MFS transporter n=1 Tax=Rhodococcus sp. WMMA185 TaxID=679318 RepID=UPI0008789B23|nr:MFS transporter [Rhodococcus sp. WMMA185]AOW93184.1 MFS transporter [Rhodococcus sp. WMMA185]